MIGIHRRQARGIDGLLGRWWAALLIALLAFMWSLAAFAQPSGTLLPETLTFSDTPAAVVEFDVPGPKTANSQTVVLLEFGPDGNAVTSPPPALELPPAARLTLSFNGNSKIYVPGSEEAGQPFPLKQVELARLQPATAPGLYALSIVHLQEIPAETVETWKLELTGLPATGVRAVGGITQGSFRSLAPTGNVYQSPQIDLASGLVRTGTTANLTLTARGFALSQLAEVSVLPETDIESVGLRDVAAVGATLSLVIGNSAAPGPRLLTVRQGDISVHKTFSLTQGPAIRIAKPRWITGPPGKATINVTALGGADFSMVNTTDISVWSPQFALDVPAPKIVAISNRDAANMTISLDDLGLGLDVFGLTLNIQTASGLLHGQFYARDHRGLQTCEVSSEHCCERPPGIVGRPDAICMACMPNDQLCQ
ncbi:hypothetical protein [Bradyrhizobium sp. HKCCYLS20291]|uniref:hypothetical protein n=1 Tax=Bradyrhizobium sp. HKCCYLS20291 TaxID=3420766 RepID=UPI003EB7F09D